MQIAKENISLKAFAFRLFFYANSRFLLIK